MRLVTPHSYVRAPKYTVSLISFRFGYLAALNVARNIKVQTEIKSQADGHSCIE